MKGLVYKICLIFLILSQISCQFAADADTQKTVQDTASSENKQTALKKENLTKADRIRWREILKWPDDCENAFSGYDDDFAGLEFYKIDRDKYVVHVVCTLGAYQGGQVFCLVKESQGNIESKLLSFEQFAEIEESSDPPDSSVKNKARFRRFTDSSVWGTITFDSEKKRLINLNRYRGIGDCGTQTVYDMTGSSPKAVEFRTRLSCTGEEVPPAQWKIYPLDEIRK